MLKKGIESILEQKFENWELIIVDDGSEDETKKVVTQINDQRIQYVFQQKAERSKARNRGIDLAKADYICFMDDDDYWLPDYLSDFYEAIQSSKKPGIFRTGLYYQKDGQLTKGVLYQTDRHHHPVRFALEEMCGVVTLCIPKVYLQEDRFPDFPHWQDTHLILRLFAKHPFQQLPNYNYVYVQHAGMGTQRIFQSDENIERRLELNLAAINHFFENHGIEMGNLIKPNSQAKLLSAKLLNYAISSAVRKNRKKANSLFKRSLQEGIFLDHWKLYGVFIKKYFLPG